MSESVVGIVDPWLELELLRLVIRHGGNLLDDMIEVGLKEEYFSEARYRDALSAM